jgi:hypothetical protein
MMALNRKERVAKGKKERSVRYPRGPSDFLPSGKSGHVGNADGATNEYWMLTGGKVIPKTTLIGGEIFTFDYASPSKYGLQREAVRFRQIGYNVRIIKFGKVYALYDRMKPKLTRRT